MNRCLTKPPRTAYKARSWCGLGKGSHSTFQRVLERSVRSVLKTKRTYGFCTAQVAPTTTRPSTRAVSRPGAPARDHPCPPPALDWSAGAPPNFSPFFSRSVETLILNVSNR